MVAALSMACGALFVTFRLLPFVDVGVHELGFVAWAYPGRFPGLRVESVSIPYWGAFLAARPFAWVLPPEVCASVPLALYAALVPLSTARLVRALGGDVRLALATAPIVFNVIVVWGFVPQLFACALLPLLWAELLAPGPRRFGAGAVRTAALALLLGYSHGFVAGFAAGTAGYIALRTRTLRRPEPWIACALLLLPSAVWFLIQRGHAAANFVTAPRWDFRWLLNFLPRIVRPRATGWDPLLYLAMLALGAVVARRATWSRPRRVLLELGALSALGMVVVPTEVAAFPVSMRFSIFMLFSVPAALLASPVAATQRHVLAAASIATVFVAYQASVLSALHRPLAAIVDRAAARIPQGTPIAYVAYAVGHPDVGPLGYLHTGAFVAIRTRSAFSVSFRGRAISHTSDVPEDMSREFYFSNAFELRRRVHRIDADRHPFWGAFLVRMPAREQGPMLVLHGVRREVLGPDWELYLREPR